MSDTSSSHLPILIKTFRLPTLMADSDRKKSCFGKKKLCEMCHLTIPTAQSKMQMCMMCRIFGPFWQFPQKTTETSFNASPFLKDPEGFLALFGNFSKKALSMSVPIKYNYIG